MATYPLDRIEIYVLAKELNRAAYPILKQIKDFGYRDQMARSALSMASNIAEGYGRYNPKSFHLFISYALGSAFEFRLQVELARDNGLIQTDDAEKLLQRLDGWIPRTINFMKSLRS
jgi:four helix bundle protein